jgi:hypothetical protein
MSKKRGFSGDLAAAIGDRRLIWFGTRGLDALPLLQLSNFEECFAITCPPGLPALKSAVLEELTRTRVDLDQYDIDLDQEPELLQLRHQLLATLNRPSIVVAYRPSRFLSAIQFARLDTVYAAYLFNEHHLAFEHKPWVETQLAGLGVPLIPWQYVPDEQHAEVFRRLNEGPVMLRPSRGSGGVGMVRVDNDSGLKAGWPIQAEAFASVAPFIDHAAPMNVAGCVFGDGSVTIHSPSIQLIGVASCIDRPFGYCGNDYASGAEIDDSVTKMLEEVTLKVGTWLRSRGYCGAFGVDYLVRGDEIFFTEVNPRFQGCSLLGSEVDRRLGLPDLYLEHIAAHLGLPAPMRPPLSDRSNGIGTVAHVVAHNNEARQLERISPAVPKEWPDRLIDITQTPDLGVAVDPGGVLFRLVIEGSVTRSGFEIAPWIEQLISELRLCFTSSESGEESEVAIRNAVGASN